MSEMDIFNPAPTNANPPPINLGGTPGDTFTSYLGTALKNINRTSFATNELLRNTIESAKGKENWTPFQDLANGFKLNKMTTGSEIISSLVGNPGQDESPAEKIARGVLGFGIDVFADPLTYVGVGGLTKIGEAAKMATGLAKAGKVVEEGSKLGEIISKLAPEQRMLASTIGEQGALGQRALLSFMGQPIGGKMINKSALGFVGAVGNAIKTMPIISDIYKSTQHMFQAVTGIPEYDDMVRKIHSDMMDKSDVYKTTFTQLSKDMKGMGEPEFSKIQDYMYGKDLNPAPAIQKVGDNLKVFFKSLADEAIDKQYMKGIVDNYMPGILTSDAMKVIKEFGTIKGIRPTELTKSINFAKQKILTKEVTPSKLNELLVQTSGKIPADAAHAGIVESLSNQAQKSLKGLQDIQKAAGKPIKKLFVTDPLEMATKRGASQIRAMTAQEMTKGARQFGISKAKWNTLQPEAQVGWRGLSQSPKELKGMLFPGRIADSLENMYKPLFNIDEANELGNTYKTMIDFWKRWTLSIFPEYHARNALGHIMNNYIASGMKSPQRYVQGAILRDLADKAPQKMANMHWQTAAGEHITGDAIYKEAKEQSLISRGMYSPENIVAAKNGAISANPFSKLRQTMQAGGNKIEDSLKLSHYLELRVRGYAPSDAGAIARSSGFDYSELTPMEKNVFRYILPFYSWTRKNLPFQLKNLMMQPGKYSELAKAKTETENQAGTANANVTWMPKWMKENFPILVGGMDKPEQYKVMTLLSWLPQGDLEKVMHPAQFLFGQLEPFSKEAIQQMSGKDFWLDKNIEDYPGQIQDFLGLNMPATVVHALKSIRLLTFLNNLNPGGVFGEYGGKQSIFGAERGLQDLTLGEKAVKNTLGVRLYPYDVQKAQTNQIAQWAGQMKQMQMLKMFAMKRNQPEKAAQIQAAIDNLTQLSKMSPQQLRASQFKQGPTTGAIGNMRQSLKI